MIRAALVAAALVACGPSNVAAPADPAPADPVGPPPATPADPPELIEMLRAADALCACPDDACADKAVDVLYAAIGEHDLSAWTADQRARFHAARWRGEDCNITLLSGADGEVLEHALEAVRDQYAGVAAEHLEQIFVRARGLHLDKTPVPTTPGGPAPAPGSCCLRSDGECPADPKLWDADPWSGLGFEVTGPQIYWYSVRVEGTVLTATAVGDIDCDGELGTFEVRGDVAADAQPKIRFTNRLE